MTWWMLMLIVIGNFTMGLVLGKYHERWEWNAKIKSGALPALRKRLK